MRHGDSVIITMRYSRLYNENNTGGTADLILFAPYTDGKPLYKWLFICINCRCKAAKLFGRFKKRRIFKMVDFKADERLNTLNHSCAHVMAQAVKHLYPHAKFWVGPVV